MFRRGPARLVALASAGALLHTLAADHVAAQAPAPAPTVPYGSALPSGLRSTLEDESDLAARLRAPTPPRRRTTETPIGQLPTFGTIRGAGTTGFNSTKSKAKGKKRTAATKSGIAPSPSLPLTLTPSIATPPPEAASARADRASASEKTAPGDKPASDKTPTGATGPARPPRAPRPPALVAREQARNDLNALPNTVVARPRPASEEDPYAPLGLRAGSFLVRTAVETAAGYNSNPGYTTIPKGSAFIAAGGELGLRSDWSRHEFIADIRGAYTSFEALHKLDRPAVDAKAAGRIDVTENDRVVVEGRYLLAAADPGRPDLPADLATLPINTAFGTSVIGAHRFNRLELALKGSVDRIEWGDSKLTDGEIISNKDRNYNQYGIEGRASYEAVPGVKPFVQVGVDTRVHDVTFDSLGTRRDSDGIAGRAGSTFELTRSLTGEAAIGYLTRTYKDPALPDLRGVLVDASLVWAATGLTNVRLGIITTPQETTIPGVSGILTYDSSLQVDHAFRRWLIGSVRLAYGIDDYVGSPRQDHRYAVGGQLTYKLTRTVQVKSEVRHEWRTSNLPGNKYEASVGLVGLRWQP